MTAAVKPSPRLASRLVNGILGIKPLAALAKNRARTMMIKRAESIGVYWRDEVKTLKARGSAEALSPIWESELAQIANAQLQYPDYYVCSFHAYEEGNLGWEPAMEVEVAAHAVHARIWEDGGAAGDARLRQSYHEILKAALPTEPRDILDLGCSVGMSTFALQSLYPQAQLTGVDLSPYFLAIAQYRSAQRKQETAGKVEQLAPQSPDNSKQTSLYTLQSLTPDPQSPAPRWLHAAAENTGLPDASFDLVSACLMFHELPQNAAIAIFHEARRLLRPGGHFAIMDMNPKSEVYSKMPPYILTLLKSTEPYLDEYFALDIEQAIENAGFERLSITCNTPRHRVVIAKAI